MGYHQHHDPNAEHYVFADDDHVDLDNDYGPHSHHHRTTDVVVYYRPDDAEHANPAPINTVYPDDYTRAARDSTPYYGRGPGA